MPKYVERHRFKWNKDWDTILTKLQGELGGKWSLIATRIEIHMHNNPEFALIRVYPSAKQCRERWVSQLDPSVSREPFTPEQITFILEKVAEGIGFNRIGRMLNHPENQVKNTYHCTINRYRPASINAATANTSADAIIVDLGPDSPENMTILHVSSSPDLKAKDSDFNEGRPEPEQVSAPVVEDYCFKYKPEERELYIPYSWSELQSNSFFRTPASWIDDGAELHSLLEEPQVKI